MDVNRLDNARPEVVNCLVSNSVLQGRKAQVQHMLVLPYTPHILWILSTIRIVCSLITVYSPSASHRNHTADLIRFYHITSY